MKTIAFYNNKGGVGKTTLAANVGYNLSVMNYRVLMVDCDPQGNLSSFFDRYDLTKKSLAQALDGQERCVYRTAYKRLDILPGNIYSESLTPQPENMESVFLQISSDKTISAPLSSISMREITIYFIQLKGGTVRSVTTSRVPSSNTARSPERIRRTIWQTE